MRIRKTASIILSVIMVIAMSAMAYAADTSVSTLGENGEQGAFAESESPASQNKTLVLNKELKAYNVDETEINAPSVSYTYTIAAATVTTATAVTDNKNVTAPVKAGVGTPVIAADGVVAWSTEETLTASTDGASNYKGISIDFSSVVFTGVGIYRYSVEEALTGTDTYAMAGVTGTNGSHIRYVDVYVRAAEGYTDGTNATDWDIYGFTCFYNNEETITEDNKTTVPVKTTGFVEGTDNGTRALVTADSYYTFNVTVSKTVAGDKYSEKNTAFPFTVIFTNDAVTKNIDIIGTASDSTLVTGWTEPAAGAVSDTKGIVNIKSGGAVKYSGIPCGTAVEIYETNVAAGVTYEVSTAVTTTATATSKDDAVISGDAPTSATAQAASKAACESTKATIATTADADDDNAYAVAVTNTFLTISPTGVMLRFAPYALVLFGGIVLLLLGKRLMKQSKKEEKA